MNLPLYVTNRVREIASIPSLRETFVQSSPSPNCCLTTKLYVSQNKQVTNFSGWRDIKSLYRNLKKLRLRRCRHFTTRPSVQLFGISSLRARLHSQHSVICCSWIYKHIITVTNCSLLTSIRIGTIILIADAAWAIWLVEKYPFNARCDVLPVD